MAIPTIVIEEHHEAFLAWNYGVLANIIPGEKNTLLHIDEHADMGTPHLRQPLQSALGDLHKIQRFTYSELSIYEFITTAVYQGLFDRLYWIQRTATQRQMQPIVINSHAGQGKALRLSVQPNQPGSDGHGAVYFVQTLAHPFAPGDSTVLDIDLDYFACDQAERAVERVEVPESEFRAFQDNAYHFLRINQGNRVQARREEGKYFLYLKEYKDDAPCPLKVSEQSIVERIAKVGAYLHQHAVNPRLITIARSRLSGYTPSDQWQFIEKHLFDMLTSIYDVHRLSLADIAPEPVPALPVSVAAGS